VGQFCSLDESSDTTARQGPSLAARILASHRLRYRLFSGSARLVRALLADGLVDELHLFVCPVAFGPGRCLLPCDGQATKLRLAGCEAYDSDAVHLTYAPATVPTNG
jgi:riboflavin biosynthesis pyrimidine reductase